MLTESKTKYGVFIWFANEKSEPLSFGRGDEPAQNLLLRRNRLSLFDSKDDAVAAMKETLKSCEGQPWTKKFKTFAIVECTQ